MDTIQAIWSILTPRQRRAGAVLLGLMLIGTMLEVLGIGVVVPVLAALAGDASGTRSPAMQAWWSWLGDPTAIQRITGALGALIVIYTVKAFYQLFTAYWHAQFVASLQASMANRLLATYLMQPWSLHVQRHAAKMVQQIHEVQGFASICSLAIVTVSELLVMAGIVVLVFWLEPVETLVVAGVFLVAAGIFEWATRGRTRRWGAARLKHSGLALQHVHQGIGGMKDAKVLGRERHFIAQYNRQADVIRRIIWRQMFVSQVPRLWFELMAITALCFVSAVLLWQGRPVESLLPTLGLFATAAFRLLPSLNRMSLSFHQLSFSAAMIGRLRTELAAAVALPPEEPVQPVTVRDAIQLDSVSYRHPGRSQPAVDRVTMRIPRGACVGLVGGSGAGKSTLVDVILGLLPPTEGRTLVDGVDIQTNIRGWQRSIGYVSQSIYLTDDTIRRNVAFGLPDEAIDGAAVLRALATARLDEFVIGLPDGLDTYVGERGVRLSGGQRQRIGIARALYHDPDVLVLDEATSSLDDATEREVMTAVHALHGRKTLIIVAHRLSTVADCDVLYRLDAGRLVSSGTLSEVMPR